MEIKYMSQEEILNLSVEKIKNLSMKDIVSISPKKRDILLSVKDLSRSEIIRISKIISHTQRIESKALKRTNKIIVRCGSLVLLVAFLFIGFSVSQVNSNTSKNNALHLLNIKHEQKDISSTVENHEMRLLALTGQVKILKRMLEGGITNYIENNKNQLTSMFNKLIQENKKAVLQELDSKINMTLRERNILAKRIDEQINDFSRNLNENINSLIATNSITREQIQSIVKSHVDTCYRDMTEFVSHKFADAKKARSRDKVLLTKKIDRDIVELKKENLRSKFNSSSENENNLAQQIFLSDNIYVWVTKSRKLRFSIDDKNILRTLDIINEEDVAYYKQLLKKGKYSALSESLNDRYFTTMSFYRDGKLNNRDFLNIEANLICSLNIIEAFISKIRGQKTNLETLDFWQEKVKSKTLEETIEYLQNM